MTVRAQDIVPGNRIVTGRRRYSFIPSPSGDKECEVVTIEQDQEGLFFRNGGGTVRRFDPNPDIYSQVRIKFPHEVLWTIQIPEATDDELRRIALATVGFQAGQGRSKPWLLHVQTVSEGTAYALPVLPREDVREPGTIYPHDEVGPDYIVGNAAIWARMVRIRTQEDHVFSPGALVVMWPDKAIMHEGIPIHIYLYALDITRKSVEGLGLWMSESMGQGGYYAGPYHDVSAIAEEEHCALLRTEPNEALVFGYLDGDSPGGMSLGNTGIVFRHSDDVLLDVFGMSDPSLGLWIAKDAKWAGSGEDCELESDLVPATLEDVQRFGYDADSFRAEVAGHFDVDPSHVLVDILHEAIAQAEEVRAIEEHGQEIVAPWFKASGQLSSFTNMANFSVRSYVRSMLDCARKERLSADGLRIANEDGGIAIRWPGYAIVIPDEGGLTITVPDGDRKYEDASKAREKDALEPIIQWLRDRPETKNRIAPHAPRTIVPVCTGD